MYLSMSHLSPFNTTCGLIYTNIIKLIPIKTVIVTSKSLASFMQDKSILHQTIKFIIYIYS